MKALFFFAVATLGSAVTVFAEVPEVPKDAVKLNGAQIAQWLNGKKFSNVVIYDAPVPIVATTNFDTSKMRVFGTYDANGSKGEFDNEWVIDGDTSCAEKTESGKWICQSIFIAGDVMYEVNKEGKLHAVSKP